MVDDVDTLRLALAEHSAERDALVRAHEEEIAQVQARARETVLTGILRVEAMRLGAHDPDLVVSQIDRTAIEWSDDGQPLGVERLLDQARQARGFLFRETGSSRDRAGLADAGIVPRPAAMQAPDARALSEPDYTARKRQFLAGII